MRRLRFLLRPGWLALAAVVVMFAFLCFWVLAPWQLGKNTSNSHRNDLITESVDSDPVAVGEALSSTGFAPDDEWRRVVAEGRYLPEKEVLVRLRSIKEAPAYEVVTPFQLDDGPIVLVNRGYVTPIQGTQPPPIELAPSGEVTLNARLRQSEGTSREPIQEADHLQVYNINPQQIGAAVGIDAVDGYLQLDDDQPGGLGVIDLPQTDSGPYLSYGLQWLAFGIMAPLGLAYFVRAEWRERRKSMQRDIADSAGPASVPEDTAPESASVPADATAVEPQEFTLPTRRELRAKAKTVSAPRTANAARLADRYGKDR
ncbi:SURF1 family protein [Rhodococcus sp. G-MC3]|uniref:SURF1 family cytochrome oxidase biogenesis protein n=1 Tax=Rhodococcus sp. G-MC3 TaxID=3046209 RepID=UPI0024BBA01D|nr:SURF1 family protein [Rhodococcus sp. G-MC3]MDJ0393000.1 SURF1 family protein [Rhodococcus sp. G-MC3]